MEKYNRTYHVPWSPGTTNDDRINHNWEIILDKPIIITEKLDGENTCLKTSGVYGRSHGATDQNAWAKNMWPIWERIKTDLTDLDYHIFGENLYGIHSIEYDNLDDHFYVFAVRHNDIWLSWDQIEEVCFFLNLKTVPVLAKFQSNRLNEKMLRSFILNHQEQGSILGGISEGIVMRNQQSFHDSTFKDNVLKWVRKNHVQTDEHWTRNWKRAPLKWEKFKKTL